MAKDKNNPPGTTGQAVSNDPVHWPDPETSHDLMHVVLDHYIKHHEVVLKKLLHAREATLQSISEIEAICEKIRTESKSNELREIKKYDDMWDQIIALFRRCGISEEEFERVEDILLSIPKAIKKYYEQLVQQDTALLKLMDELESDEYKQAFTAVQKIQSQPNLVTGLGPEEYNLAAEYEEKEVHFFKNLPAGKKKLH